MISPFPNKPQVPPLASSTPVQRVEPTVVSCAKRPSPSAVGPTSSSPPASDPPPPPPQPPVTTAKPKPQPKIILSTRNEPIGLNVADFLP
ncbi:katanin p80 WD40 repeat-containing subunit B1-like, partial [Plectropomus leopardus]|uniref:katanin p80 WD40 repeat-containing subunit B1-like n=1 Tax=Plectropomus leopardus TaxID=160734 RepID=UPI001C4B9575